MSDETVTLSREEYEEVKAQLIELDAELSRLLAQPLVYATVVKADNKFNLDVFEQGDRMLVLDKDLRKKKKYYGKISSKGVDKDGWVVIDFPMGGRERLNIGLNGEIPQVKLLGKDDGMNVVITIDGKLFEVHGLPGTFFQPSENVKVDMETKQIHESTGVSSAGDVAYVKSIIDPEHVEVEQDGKSRVVIFSLKDGDKEQEIKPSDRVMLDNSNTVILRILERDGKDRFNLRSESNTTWDDIAGVELAKDELIEALELPYQNPEIYAFYGMKPPKGVMLYGPPGNGKTMCGKAAAYSLAKTHGKENMESGFIYVKGPELLSKWVGQTEQEIRALFARGREHFQMHGYPAVLFIDEADAIMPVRGSGKSSDVENTIVPQFLSEMDGMEESGVMVLLATNQPKRLDPAVTRPGRIDRHVKISRPTATNAAAYFKLHMKGMPVVKGSTAEDLAKVGVAEMFHEKRVLYRITDKGNVQIFRFGDAASGAMIAGVVAQAKSIAMKRDLGSKGKPKGVTADDIATSVQNHFVQYAGLNPMFDLEEFCEIHGIEKTKASIERAQV